MTIDSVQPTPKPIHTHPFALFCLHAFHAGPRSSDHSAVNMHELTSMPMPAQLLLAYCLDSNTRQLLLLRSDKDISEMLSNGWLSTSGWRNNQVITVEFKPEIWRKLTALRHQFCTTALLEKAEVYRARKSAQYPWLW